MPGPDPQKKVELLVEISDILGDLSVEYRLGTGALLGVVREGNFIPWDWDIGLDIPAEQLLRSWDNVINAVEGSGFTITVTERTFLNGKICAEKDAVDFELMGWRRDRKGNRRRRKLLIPADIWDGQPIRLDFQGCTVSTYPKPEEYLKHFYGDWRTPIKATTASAKSSYLSSDVHVRDYFDSILYLPHFLKKRMQRQRKSV